MTSAELLTLLADPERVDSVPPHAIPALIGEAAALQARLWARLQAGTLPVPAPAGGSGNGKPDRMLTAREAADALGVDPRWVYRHAGELPFTRRLTSGTLRFSARGLERWKETRR